MSKDFTSDQLKNFFERYFKENHKEFYDKSEFKKFGYDNNMLTFGFREDLYDFFGITCRVNDNNIVEFAKLCVCPGKMGTDYRFFEFTKRSDIDPVYELQMNHVDRKCSLPTALTDDDIEEFACALAKEFDITSSIRLIRQVNIGIINLIDCIKKALDSSFKKPGIRIVRLDFDEKEDITETYKSLRDYYTKTTPGTIEFFNGHTANPIVCISKLHNDSVNHTYSINWTTRVSGTFPQIIINKDGWTFYEKDGEALRLKSIWQKELFDMLSKKKKSPPIDKIMTAVVRTIIDKFNIHRKQDGADAYISFFENCGCGKEKVRARINPVGLIDFTNISSMTLYTPIYGLKCSIFQVRENGERRFYISWDPNRSLDEFPHIVFSDNLMYFSNGNIDPPVSGLLEEIQNSISTNTDTEKHDKELTENECTEDTTENETLDEELKNRINYIMDHVLDLLIEETKKSFNKDVVAVDCYDYPGKPPIRQFLDFKGVDISNFTKFVCELGFWNVHKSRTLSNDNKVTYCITWPGVGVTSKITITRNYCDFSSGNIPRNDLMDSALPKIKELCEAFNDDTPENKTDDKLALNEGEEEKSVDEMINETALDITRMFRRNNLIKDILVRIAIAVNGTTNTRNDITFQKDKKNIKTAKSFCDIDVYSYDTFVIGDKDKDKFIVVKRIYSDNSILYISNTAKNGTAIITITDKSANFVKGSLLFSSNEYEKTAAVEINRLCEKYSESFKGVSGAFVASTPQKENDVSHVPPIDDKPAILDKDSINTITFNPEHDVSNMIYNAFKFVVDKYTKHSKCPISRIPRLIYDKSINPTFFGYSINIPIDHNGRVRQEIVLRCDKIEPIKSRYEATYCIGCGDTCSHSPLMISVYRDGYCRIGRVRGDVSTNLFVDKVTEILEELIKHHNDSLAEKRLNQLKTTHKEENNMNNKKNEEYMIQGIIPEYEFGKYYKKDGDKFVVVEDDKKWGSEVVYTNEGSALEPKFEKVVFSTAIATTIKDVIFSDPATTVIWADGTKTTVSRQVTKYQPTITSTGAKNVPAERVPFDPEAALAAAIMNKLFGTHSRYSKFVKGYVAEAEEKAKKKAELKAKKEAAKAEKAEKEKKKSEQKTPAKRTTTKKTPVKKTTTKKTTTKKSTTKKTK